MATLSLETGVIDAIYKDRFRVEKHFSIVIDHSERKKHKYKYNHLLRRCTSHRFR